MTPIVFLFLTLVFLSNLLFYLGTDKNNKLVSILIIWQFVVAFFSYTHFFKNHPKTFPITLIGNALLLFYLQNQIKITSRTSIFWIILNTLRIPIELILFQLFLDRKIPQLMTFMGWNFDIIIGITAVVLLMYKIVLKKEPQKTLFLAWNILGILFLSTIVLLAIVSSPLPIQLLAFDQPNIAILYFPYSLLPSSVVVLAFLSHILFLKSIHSIKNKAGR